MWFVHPVFLAVTAGLLLLPPIIHVINRRRFRREPWAATRFLIRAHRRSQRRMQMEHWLLLVVRTLALALIGLAIARPYVAGRLASLGAVHAVRDHVIVLDDSLSMSARREDGVTSFDAARAAAIKLLDSLSPGDGVALVTASAPVRTWVDRPVGDASLLRSILNSIRCTSRPTDLRGALDAADKVMARGRAERGRRIAYVLTDLARSSVGDSDVAAGLTTPALDDVRFLNVGPSLRGNVSVSSLHLVSPIVGIGVPTRIEMAVTNHGDDAAAGLRARFSVDGRIAGTREIGNLNPGEKQRTGAEVTFSDAGPHIVTASLIGGSRDVLAADDSCSLAVPVRRTLKILLVEPENSFPPSERSLFFFRVAMETRGQESGTNSTSTRTLSPADLESALLSEFQVIVLGDVFRLPERAWARLQRFVRRGGGLVMLLGPDVDATHYNEWAFNVRAAGSQPGDVEKSEEPPVFALQSKVQLPVTDSGVTLMAANRNHPILADFIGHDEGGLFRATAHAYWRAAIPDGSTAEKPPESQPASTGKSLDGSGVGSHRIDTILAFSDGAAALLVGRWGRGRVVVSTMGVRMSDSTLPSKPDFVPLAFNLCAYAAGDDHDRLNVAIGDTLIGASGAVNRDEPATVTGPDGASRSTQIEPFEDSMCSVFRDTELPGAYRMRQTGESECFAVNIRDGESDLRTMDEGAIRARFGARASVVASLTGASATARAAQGGEWAGVSMYLALALVLFESWIARGPGGGR